MFTECASDKTQKSFFLIENACEFLSKHPCPIALFLTPTISRSTLPKRSLNVC